MKDKFWSLCRPAVVCLLLGLAVTSCQVGSSATGPSPDTGGAEPDTEISGSALVVSIAAPAEANLDSDFTAKINVTEVTDLDAAQFDISYDKDVLHMSDVTDGLIDGVSIPVDWAYVPGGGQETDIGKIRVICSFGLNEGPASGTGYLAEIHFHVVGPSGSSSKIRFPDDATLLLGDKDANPIPVDEWKDSLVHVR